jgi:hypothetical protein
MRKILLFVIAVFAISLISRGQAAGDYRTVANGDWNSLSTWERYSGSAWQALTGIAPLTIPSSADGVITIQAHSVTVTADVTVDQVQLNIGSSLTINNGITLTIADGTGTDFAETNSIINVDGTLIVNSGALFTGGGGNGASTGNLNVNSTGVLTVDGTIQGTGTVHMQASISGSVGITGAITDLFSVIVNSGGNVVATGTGSLILNNGSTPSLLTVSSGGSVSVTGSGTVSSNRGNGGSVISISGIISMTGTSVITALGVGTLLVNSGGTLELGSNAIANGNIFTLASGGTLKIGSTAGIVSSGATGNVQTSSRSFNTGANYTYNGNAGAQVTGNGLPATVNNLTIDNSSGVTLSQAVAVNGVMTFINGVVTSTNAIMLTINNDATVSGASNSSYVDGPMAKKGDDNFTYPAGDPAGSYHPISINNTGAATTDSYTAEYFRASALTKGPLATPPGLYTVSNCEYWQVTKNSGSGTPGVTISWTTNSPCGGNPYVTQLPGLTVAWLNGSNEWQLAPGTSTNVTGTTSSGTVERVGISSFGYFALGSLIDGGSPLPVHLSNIKAYEKQQGIQLDWTAYQEENLSRYSIERSPDGSTFTSIGEVTSLNSALETKYGFFDASPLAGVNLYRLKSIDFDSRYGYSSIVKVNLDKSVKDISLYPNPATSGFISFQGADLAKGNYIVRVYNSAGIQVMGQNFIHTGGAINQTLKLPAGIKSGLYSLQLVNDGVKVLSKTFVVQ